MTGSVVLLGWALSLGCSTTGATQNFTLESSPADGTPLPNGAMQSALPLVPGEEISGTLNCGQVAWYRVGATSQQPMTIRILGQAQENALGATATLTVHSDQGAALGELLIPVFSRAPNWDPREQPFAPPAPGVYFASVRLDPNGCQRVAFRLALR